MATIVVDDFTSGNYIETLPASGVSSVKHVESETNTPGGFRKTHFSSIPLLAGNKSFLNINTIAGLASVSNDFRVNHRLEIIYGANNVGQAPLNRDLSACSKFNIQFSTIDLGLNVNITVFSGGGTGRASIATDVNRDTHPDVGLNSPVLLEVFLTDFYSPPSLPVNWNDIDVMSFILQTGNATGGNDYAIDEISIACP